MLHDCETSFLVPSYYKQKWLSKFLITFIDNPERRLAVFSPPLMLSSDQCITLSSALHHCTIHCSPTFPRCIHHINFFVVFQPSEGQFLYGQLGRVVIKKHTYLTPVTQATYPWNYTQPPGRKSAFKMPKTVYPKRWQYFWLITDTHHWDYSTYAQLNKKITTWIYVQPSDRMWKSAIQTWWHRLWEVTYMCGALLWNYIIICKPLFQSTFKSKGLMKNFKGSVVTKIGRSTKINIESKMYSYQLFPQISDFPTNGRAKIANKHSLSPPLHALTFLNTTDISRKACFYCHCHNLLNFNYTGINTHVGEQSLLCYCTFQ